MPVSHANTPPSQKFPELLGFSCMDYSQHHIPVTLALPGSINTETDFWDPQTKQSQAQGYVFTNLAS